MLLLCTILKLGGGNTYLLLKIEDVICFLHVKDYHSFEIKRKMFNLRLLLKTFLKWLGI